MMSFNGRPTLPSRNTLKRVVAAAVVAGAGAGITVAAAGGATAQTAPSSPAAGSASAQYTVVSGDWLSKIATAHNVQGGWQKLYALNKSVLTKGPDVLFPGQQLTLTGSLPTSGAQQQAPTAAKPAPQPSTAPAASTQDASQSTTVANAPTGGQVTAVPVAAPVANTPASLQALAATIVPADQLASFDQIITHESGWNVTATNPSSGAYGLPQALPGSKMASAGADWQTNPATQMRWALQYMNTTYGSPNDAWAFWQIHHAY
ncbi:LysM peptidoglycan-binding domain-containing protein [Kitasatospora sp. NPDC052896]|uniref:LysM peptidoglycan-binding domain-containing protein n=1 Tax=Kitasatospora sp. NPDC052896 TaxID=3364061 RepID=UPI0037C94DF4